MKRIFLILIIVILVMTPLMLNAGALSFEPYAGTRAGYIQELDFWEVNATVGGSFWHDWIGIWVFGSADSMFARNSELDFEHYSNEYTAGGKLMFGQPKTVTEPGIQFYLFYEYNFSGENMDIYGVGFQFGTKY